MSLRPVWSFSRAASWGQTFTFDHFGSRNFDEANTTTLPRECIAAGNPAVCEAMRPIVNPSVNTANNRLNGYAFDAAGNMTADPQGRRFTYDAENKQVKVETIDENGNPIATVGQYAYDGDGKRVKKIVPSTGEVTIFVYDAGGKLVAEYSTSVAPVEDAKVAYLTNDHLGSPRINTDRDGTVTSRHDYHPFGEEIDGTGGRNSAQGYGGQDNIRQKFTSYERDSETDLDFAQARYYKSEHGRFTSPDDFFKGANQSQPQSQNLYVYVTNNPLLLTDPTGESPTDFVDTQTGVKTNIDDGNDQVILTTTNDINEMQREFNSGTNEDKAAYTKNLQEFQNSDRLLRLSDGTPITTGQFNDLAGVIYAKASKNSNDWRESAAIYGVLNNRATANGTTAQTEANAPGVYGAAHKNDASRPNASQAKLNSVYLGLARGLYDGRRGIDYSGGAYYWQGVDFSRHFNGMHAYEGFYKVGFHFTSKSHDIFNMGDHKSGNRKWDFKYESTAAYGKTVFMKLTTAWQKANGSTRWDGR